MLILRSLVAVLVLSESLSAQDKPQQLVPLKRVTVGPYDNYQGSVDESRQLLYYTRSQNLSSQVFRFDLRTGLSTAVTELNADAKSPVISPDGKILALTYFKQDAKGDVCLLEDQELRCFTQAGVVDHSPFWIGSGRLGYIASNDAGTQHQLMVYDLASGQTSKRLEGVLHHPQLAPDGRTLVARGRGNELVFYDFETQQLQRRLVMNLPGVTGPAVFSGDGRFLYFVQYIVDSNRDLLLDGRDAAAIYRIAVDAKAGTEPEQLTSLQQNCSYPVLTSDRLYMTCAFEGALDIYSSPLTGTVPAVWTKDDLWEAHRAARSYSDRILFVNHLFARFQALSATEHDERSFANFVFLGEYLPAHFFAKRLAENAAYPEASRARLEGLLLEAYARWEVLPQKENLGAFARFLEQQAPRVLAERQEPLAAVVQAYFAYFSHDKGAARKLLREVSSEDPRVLFWRSRLERFLLRTEDAAAYRQTLEQRVLSPRLSQETRLYYLAQWFDELPPGASAFDHLEAFAKKVPSGSYLLELLHQERDLRRMITSRDEKEQITLYRGIVRRVQAYQKDYFTLRLLFSRSLITFSSANRARDMGDIVNLWLSYLQADSKEFPLILEAMRRNSLDIAYRFYHGSPQEKGLAAGAFYTNLRTSDDLESHFQYSLSQLDPKAWQELEAAYATMVQDKMIRPTSFDFVRTVRRILAQTETVESDDLQQAIQVIDGLPDSYVGLGTKYLFLGYLYQRQMLLEGRAFAYDRDLADLAHRSYLFAIDAAYGNDRIIASALQNLALLHESMRNSSLAAEFFTKRRELDYKDSLQEQAVLWLAARALYRSYRAPEALAAIEEALAKGPEPRAPFLEKAAFYAWNAQAFDKAVNYYGQFLARPEGPVRAGIYLAYGYALSRSGASQEAAKALQQAVEISLGEPIPRAEGPALMYQPEKVRFIAYGLLAKLDQAPAQRVVALQERLAMFPSIQDKAKVLHFSPETLASQEVKERQDLAYLHQELQNAAAALAELERSLQLARAHGKEYGWLSHTVMMAAKNAMIWLREQQLTSARADGELGPILSAIAEEYKDQDAPSGLVTQKWGELRVVSAAYATRKQGKEAFRRKSAAMLDEEPFRKLQREQPRQFEALRAYQEAWVQSVP